MDRIVREVSTAMRRAGNAARSGRRVNVAGRRNSAVAVNSQRSGDQSSVSSEQSVHIEQDHQGSSESVTESRTERSAPGTDKDGTTP